jgi:type I restriction enzyme S subunit
VSPSELDPETPYVGLEHIPRRSTTLTDWGKASSVASLKLRFQRGHILFGKIRPYFHKVSVAPLDGVASSDAIIIKARRPEWWPIVLGCVSSDAFVAHAVQTSNGTKMPRTNWDVLVRYPVILPPEPILQQVGGAMVSMVDLCRTLMLQSRNLRAQRDLLLPKLISGEIDVSEAPAARGVAA